MMGFAPTTWKIAQLNVNSKVEYRMVRGGAALNLPKLKVQFPDPPKDRYPRDSNDTRIDDQERLD